MKNNRVLVGISGGVDSAVSAFLLKEKGYEVEGLTMVMFGSDEENKGLINSARAVATSLNIKHHILDARTHFKKRVIKNFVDEYRLGRTPNPCVECNKYIKFGLFLDYAKDLCFDYISTGHYAKILYDEDLDEYLLKKSDFEKKDQSYFLYNLNQEIMSKALFPLGILDKDQVKKISSENNLVSSKTKESQDICFIPDGDYVSFLERETGQKAPVGDFVDETGNVFGKHLGIWKYTIGQRKGLGDSFNKKMFVSEIDAASNRVILKDYDPVAKELVATDVNIVSKKLFKENMRLEAKIRYGHKQKPAQIKLDQNGDVIVIFDEPQRAITKGQSVVFYKDDIVIAGGIIK